MHDRTPNAAPNQKSTRRKTALHTIIRTRSYVSDTLIHVYSWQDSARRKHILASTNANATGYIAVTNPPHDEPAVERPAGYNCSTVQPSQ